MFTRADLFQRTGEKTPAFVRFSTVAGSKGRPIWRATCVVCRQALHTAKATGTLSATTFRSSSSRTPSNFPTSCMPSKQEPDRGFPQAPLGARQLLGLHLADPRKHAHDHVGDVGPGDPALVPLHGGFRGSHLSLRQRGREVYLCEISLEAEAGLQSVVWNEAVKINGADPDFHRRDLWNAIKAGDFPEWEWAFNSSTMSSRTTSPSTCSTRPS